MQINEIERDLNLISNPNNNPYTGHIIKEGDSYYFVYNPLQSKKLNKKVLREDPALEFVYTKFKKLWSENKKKVEIDIEEFDKKTTQLRKNSDITAIQLLDAMVESKYKLYKFLVTKKRLRDQQKWAVPFLLFMYIRQYNQYMKLIDEYERSKGS